MYEIFANQEAWFNIRKSNRWKTESFNIRTCVKDFMRVDFLRDKIIHKHIPGAIIRDGDRKSWDARGPMIWDNFSIFRTNCAILTSYFRADPRTYRGLSRGCCHVV